MTAIFTDLTRAARQRAALVVGIHAGADAVTDGADPVRRRLGRAHEAERDERTNCELIPFGPHAYASPKLVVCTKITSSCLQHKQALFEKEPKFEQNVSM
ncbi:MAG TPA: hypothetical protein VNM90_14630 [Haliangium sp.]|nr:hypothetical protein [Haliangium sp.]